MKDKNERIFDFVDAYPSQAVFASNDESPKGKPCDAIMGIIDEGKEIMSEYRGMPALDAALLASAQAVEHYATRTRSSCSTRR